MKGSANIAGFDKKSEIRLGAMKKLRAKEIAEAQMISSRAMSRGDSVLSTMLMAGVASATVAILFGLWIANGIWVSWAEIMGAINTASWQQSNGVEQVDASIAQIDQTTKQNAALVEQIAAAATSLKTQADELVQAVAVFKL